MICLLCLFVFFLGLQQKLFLSAHHGSGSTFETTPSSWQQPNKMENKLELDSLLFLPPVWLVARLFSRILTAYSLRPEQVTDIVPRYCSLFELHRFLRPPPAV